MRITLVEQENSAIQGRRPLRSGRRADACAILLGFAVFTTYTLILVSQTNTALFATFLLLWITLIVLAIGSFNAGAAGPLAPTTTLKIGGYLGVVTAAIAWYTSAADFSTGMGGKLRFPVGPPLIK